MKNIVLSLLAAFALLLFAGCGKKAPTSLVIDGSTAESMQKSMDNIYNNLSEEKVKKFNECASLLLIKNKAGSFDLTSEKAREVLHGKSVPQVIKEGREFAGILRKAHAAKKAQAAKEKELKKNPAKTPEKTKTEAK